MLRALESPMIKIAFSDPAGASLWTEEGVYQAGLGVLLPMRV